MDYSNLQNMAYNQIVDKGRAMSIIRQTRSSFGVSTGGYTTIETTYSCYGVRLDFKKKDHLEGSVIENSLQGMQAIEANSVLFLIAAKNMTITPARTDRILFASTTYEIEEVETLSPNGVDIIYKVKARK
jgi:hypothetical protein